MLFVLGTATYAQVGIGTASPNKASMLDITSTNKGVLISRIALTSTADATTVQVTAAEAGMLVFNTATIADVLPGFYFWNGAKWTKVGKDSQNGLTDNGSTVKLGGVLTESLTTITADGTNATVADRKLLAIAGLAPSDNTQTNVMLVADATTGELRTATIALPLTVETTNVDLALLSTMETVLADATSGDITVTLPDAATSKGKKYYIKKIDTSSNLVNIASAGGTIDFVPSIYGGVYLQNWLIQSDGTNWYVIK